MESAVSHKRLQQAKCLLAPGKDTEETVRRQRETETETEREREDRTGWHLGLHKFQNVNT